jgi:antirestriction protein ArdC
MVETANPTVFEHFSAAHAAILAQEAAARPCGCVAYADWFTYRRWLAQGYQVQKGEHGVRLTTFIPVTREGDDGEAKTIGTRPWHTTVFCRCQVKEKNA